MGIELFLRQLWPIVSTEAFSGAASQLAYSLLLAVIPLIMAVITIASRIDLPVEEIYRSLSLILPVQSYETVKGVINEVLASKNLTGFTIFSALSFVADGCRSFMYVSNVAEGVKESRSFAAYWAFSYVFAVSIVACLLLSLLLVVFGEAATNALAKALLLRNSWLIAAARYAGLIIFSGGVFTLMYAWVSEKKKKISETAAGGFSAAFLWVAISSAFGFYVSNFTNYGLLFGSLGGVFVLLVWLYYSSYALILGIAINSALRQMAENKARLKTESQQ